MNITLRFDDKSSQWCKDSFEYNEQFVYTMCRMLETKFNERKYLYFREIVESLGLDPHYYIPILGWDSVMFPQFDFHYKIEKDENEKFIDITFNPIGLVTGLNNYKEIIYMAGRVKNNYDYDRLIGKVIDYEGALKFIQNGVPVSDACERLNIDVNEFRRFISTERLDFKYDSVSKLINSTNEMLGYERLYLSIIGKKITKISEIPYDVDKGFINAMRTLTERERIILKEYYIGCRILNQIAARHKVTIERVRQIKARAERKLRQPHRYRMWVHGWHYYIYTQNLRKQEDKVICSEETIKFENHVRDLVESKDREALYEIYNDLKHLLDDGYFEDEVKNETKYDTSIIELELSVRSYNCLYRANIKTYGDLNGMTYSKLMKIRNLGRKSFNEIIEKAKVNGIEIVNDVIGE